MERIAENGTSLKFQFPSNGKAEHKRGKRIRIFKSIPSKFQFPSNGKAEHKRGDRRMTKQEYQSFNSLQTGKRSTSDP